MSRTTLAAVILEYMGLYCEASWSPGWGHLYVSHFAWTGRMALIVFPDCGNRLDIRLRRHVLFDPALRRGLRPTQTTQAFAQIVLREGSW